MNIDKDVTIAAGNSTCGSLSPGAVTYAATTTRVFTIGAGRVVTLRGFHISGGSATIGGLVKVSSGGSLTLEDMALDFGAATDDGGCLYVDNGELHATDTSFIRCSAGRDGGGVFVSGNTTSTIDVDDGLSTVEDCTAGRNGGGLLAAEGAQLQVTATVVTGCAADYGGGISAVGYPSTVGMGGSSWVGDNEASAFGGAGAALQDGAISVGYTRVEANHARPAEVRLPSSTGP